MASGRPVIAFGRGGATETVVAGKTGVFFDVQSVEAIIDAIERFQQMEFNPADAVARASDFRTEVFLDRFRAMINEAAGIEPAWVARSALIA
jgi:glycosyltransferase involved in cell wall biosynthesis